MDAMTESATPPGALDDKAEEKEAKVIVNPRDEALAAIDRMNNERVAKELGLKVEDLGFDDAGDPDQDQDDAVAEAERKRLEREADAAERQAQLDKQLDKQLEPTVLENFEHVMVKTKVDGKEVVRPLADLVRMDQKEAAINKRLEQAAYMRQEAERLLAETKSAKPSDAAQPTQPTAPVAGAKEFLDAIYAGEEDKALAAANRLFGEGRTPATPDPEAIAQRVKQQIDTERALESFGSNYQEIVADPYLADIADRFLSAELELGTPMPTALTKAGEQTRDWLKQKAGSVAPTTTTTTLTRDDKLERKKSIDVIPSVNAAATSSTQPAIESQQDIIAEMRRQRGQAF